jgi:signal peptidase II
VSETEQAESVAASRPVTVFPATPSTSQRSRVIAIAAIVIVIDQLSKMIIEMNLPLYRAWEPIPAISSFFRIFHVSNTGAAFGLFPAGSQIITVAAILVTIAIIVYNYRLREAPFLLRLALGLQLGGALGNLIDRFRIGHVTDFFDFGPWPVFNFADFFVVSGAILLAWIFWQEDRRMNRSHVATGESDEFSSAPAHAPKDPGIDGVGVEGNNQEFRDQGVAGESGNQRITGGLGGQEIAGNEWSTD